MSERETLAAVNRMIDRALELQNEGLFSEGDSLLDEAEAMLDRLAA